ncbi:MAG: EAL domain-containing protein [Pseudomonadota bacterium]
MSLQRRLILAISLLLMILLAVNMVMTVYNARQHIFQQLEVHAQDTATSLGFSISQAAQGEDIVQVSSMIDVIFDRGYYRQIVYRTIDGEVLINRELPLRVINVPQWFVDWVYVPEPVGEAVISSGWLQLGDLTITSHPGFAYQDLWRAFKNQLWIFLFVFAVSYGLIGIGLKMILKPLRELEAQAEAISRKEFAHQDPLPAVPELRRVVIAMNTMVDKLKRMFGHQVELNDRLHQQLRTDEITGLSNRHDFDERLQAYLKSERTTNLGLLMLMQIGDLQDINHRSGRQQGDDYLHSVAKRLLENLSDFPDAIHSRHSGADFAVFIPALSEDEGKHLVEALSADLQALEWSGEKVQPIFIGALYAADLSQYAHAVSDLMSRADAALNQARSEQQGGSHWSLLDSQQKQQPLTASQWGDLLERALLQQAFQFRYQPVWTVVHGEQQLLFNELLTHLYLDDNSYPASEFIPAATRLHLMPRLDRQIIDTLVANEGLIPERLCVNVSTAALDDKPYIQSLRRHLEANVDLAKRLLFELPANSLSVAEQQVREFANLVTGAGAGVSLHHFGRGTSEFAYMQSLPLNYLKIDRCFIQNITTDKDAQFFVRSLVNIAHSCDVTILAEGVETQAQWQQLITLGIQGGQGYWLGRPQASPVIA